MSVGDKIKGMITIKGVAEDAKLVKSTLESLGIHVPEVSAPDSAPIGLAIIFMEFEEDTGIVDGIREKNPEAIIVVIVGTAMKTNQEMREAPANRFFPREMFTNPILFRSALREAIITPIGRRPGKRMGYYRVSQKKT